MGEHVANYFQKRTDVKPNTLIHWRQAKRCLIDYFDANRMLSSITAGDARNWERWLRTGAARKGRYVEAEATDGLALNTARKRLSDAKQFFQDAVSRDILVKNPFLGLNGSLGSNRDHD